jgi:hypothetical protein
MEQDRGVSIVEDTLLLMAIIRRRPHVPIASG